MKTFLGYFCVYLVLATSIWQSGDCVQLSQKSAPPAYHPNFIASQGGGAVMVVLSSREHGSMQVVYRSLLTGLPISPTGIAPSTVAAIQEHASSACVYTNNSDSLLDRGSLLTI